MKLQIFFLFAVILSFFNIGYGVDVIEVQCLKDIANKFQDTLLNVPKIETTFCQGGYGKCYSNGSISELTVTPTNQLLINSTDVSCFPLLTFFKAINATIDTSLLTVVRNSLTKITLVTKNLASIDFEIASLNTFEWSDYLKTSLTITPFALKNVKTFASSADVNLIQGSNNGYINNFTTGYASSPINIPDLTNMIKVGSISIGLNALTYNESSFVNFQTFSGTVKSISISGSGSIRFPTELATTGAPRDYIYFGVSGFNAPSSYIDLSNIPYVNTFIILSMGQNFNYQGNFPFSRLPLKVGNLQFFKGNTPNVDWSIFSNVTGPMLQDLKIETPLPPSNPFGNIVKAFDISINKITGTLDDSWCVLDLIVNRNQLTGKIPDCFYCYLNETSTGYSFGQNNFNNYEIVNNKCGYDKIVPYIYYNTTTTLMTLQGKNLGFYQNNFKTSTCVIVRSNYQFMVVGCTGNYTNVTFLNQNLNFTLSLDRTEPKIDSIVQSNNTLTITGSYFSYEPSIMNITIGTTPLKCQVTNTSIPTFYSIQCDIQYPVIEYGPRNVTVQVNSLVSKPYEINLNYTKFPCPVSDCNGNGICNDHIGICECFNNWISVPDDICTVPIHYLSAYTQVSDAENGGILYLYGFFGDIHNGLKVLIDGSQCAIEVGPTSTTIVISVNPGTIGKNSSIEIYQNTLTFYGTIYPYLNPIKECPSNCNSHGKCNTTTGECSCQNGYTGVDCIAKTNSTLPSITSSISNFGAVFRSEQTVFTVSPYLFFEVDYKGIVISYPSINWRTENTNQGVKFISTSENNATFELTYLKVTQNQQFSFAGNEFTVGAGGIKMSITVSNYTYSNQSNFLVAALRANVESDLSVTQNKCNNGTTVFTSQSNSNVTLNNYNYFTISKDAKRLSIRVQDRLISDNQPTFMVNQLQTKLVDNSLVFGMTLPHCGKQCSIDGPDFIVNVEPNYKTASSCAPTSTTSSSENQPSSSIRESSISIILIIIPILISLSF
ncbi:hypothetical protein RB653_007626 [Dictyostelium firmibasis]|uniref:EGF-like domain-containing protein n=1 Tax=Dictyostelium firmibasis TaxID=79012 RepID=A0AAN7TM49_9MYCE